MELAWAGIGLSVLLWIAGYSLQTYLYYTQAPPGYFPIPYSLLQPDPNVSGQIVPPAAYEQEDKRVFIKGYMTPGRQYRSGRMPNGGQFEPTWSGREPA